MDLSWLLQLLVPIISGAVGGNIAGALFKNLSLGTLGNSLAGVVGGGVGGHILSNVLGVGTASGVGTLEAVGSQVAGGGIGGIVVMIIVAVLKKVLGR